MILPTTPRNATISSQTSSEPISSSSACLDLPVPILSHSSKRVELKEERDHYSGKPDWSCWLSASISSSTLSKSSPEASKCSPEWGTTAAWEKPPPAHHHDRRRCRISLQILSYRLLLLAHSPKKLGSFRRSGKCPDRTRTRHSPGIPPRSRLHHRHGRQVAPWTHLPSLRRPSRRRLVGRRPHQTNSPRAARPRLRFPPRLLPQPWNLWTKFGL